MEKIQNLKNMLLNKTPEDIRELLTIQNDILDTKDKIRYKLNIVIEDGEKWEMLPYNACILFKNNYPKIWIGNHISEPKQNFILAHQLGHIVNDILPNPEKYQKLAEHIFKSSNEENNPIEIRADNFAMRFLMPAKLIDMKTRELTECKDFDQISLETIIKRLSDFFKVPFDLMKKRLEQLGYLEN